MAGAADRPPTPACLAHRCRPPPCRDVVGVALKTLGLGFNASVAEAARCGLAEEDLRTRVQRLVKQARQGAGRPVTPLQTN